jgi:hypothetical protein
LPSTVRGSSLRKSAKLQSKPCPYCGKMVSAAAVVCIHCDHDLIDLNAPELDEEEELSSAPSSPSETESSVATNGTATATATTPDTRTTDFSSETPLVVPVIEVDRQQFAAEALEFAAQTQARAAKQRKRVITVGAIASVVILGAALFVAKRDTRGLRSGIRNTIMPQASPQALQIPRVPLSQIPDLFAVQLAAGLPVTRPETPAVDGNGRIPMELSKRRTTIGNAFQAGQYVLPDDLRLAVAEIRNETGSSLTDFVVTAEFYDKAGKSLGKLTHKTNMVAQPGESFSFAIPFSKRPADLPAQVTNPLASIGPLSANRMLQGSAPLHPVVLPKSEPGSKATSGRIVSVTARVVTDVMDTVQTKKGTKKKP